MSYIDQSLGQSERIVARADLAWVYRVVAWTALIVGLAVAAYLLTGGREWRGASWAALLVAALGVAAFFGAMIPVWTTEIGVTNQRLIVKKGWLNRSSEELQLWSIEEVDWEQGVLERPFGFGHLVVNGTGDDNVRLPLISNALEFRRAVQDAIAAARPAQRPG